MADDETPYLDDEIEDPARITRFADQVVEQHPIEQLERVRARIRMGTGKAKKARTYSISTSYANRLRHR